MKSKLTLFFTLAFVIGMFSITSSGQTRLEQVRATTASTATKVEIRSENWAVFVVDSVVGNTQKIKPKSESKLEVFVTSFPPNNDMAKKLKSTRQTAKKDTSFKAVKQTVLRTASSSKVSSKNSLSATIPILVNPAVRTALKARRKKD